MGLHPQARALMELMEGTAIGALGPGVEPQTVRDLMEGMILPSDEHVALVRDRMIPGPAGPIPVRVYHPEATDPIPVIVHLHGGGWVLGSVETHDGSCRALANAVPAVVVSVEYRLAPEARFPAAVDDAYAATVWVAEHAAELGGDPARIAVAGDSAGGNLAAVTALMAREHGGPALRYQLLVYPVTDYEFDSPSMHENAEGYFLTVEGMRWFFGYYLRDPSDAADWRVSPARAEDLRDLPPAFVLTAEYDPLRDQGEAYAERLAAAGIAVDARRYDGVFHGFFSMQAFMEPAKDAFDDVVVALQAGLAP